MALAQQYLFTGNFVEFKIIWAMDFKAQKIPNMANFALHNLQYMTE